MFNLTDIHPLTDFLRDHKTHMARLRKAGRPEVLTVNGKAELVIQDAASYQKLLDIIDRAEAIAGIQRGLESMQRGRGRPMRDFLKEIRAKSGGAGK